MPSQGRSIGLLPAGWLAAARCIWVSGRSWYLAQLLLSFCIPTDLHSRTGLTHDRGWLRSTDPVIWSTYYVVPFHEGRSLMGTDVSSPRLLSLIFQTLFLKPLPTSGAIC